MASPEEVHVALLCRELRSVDAHGDLLRRLFHVAHENKTVALAYREAYTTHREAHTRYKRICVVQAALMATQMLVDVLCRWMRYRRDL